MVNGLASADVQQVLANVKAENIVNASDVIEKTQMDSLSQAITNNTAAAKNAQELTTELQTRGLLKQGERVVGVSGTTIYKIGQP
jgi:hypothetical protein